MNRVRWLSAEWPLSIRTVGKRLLEMPFSEEKMHGFLIERIRDDHVEGRYVEKYSYEEVISNPFGCEDVVDRVGYRTTEFTLYSTSPQIELRNCQRSVKGFVSRLLEACSFNLVVKPPTVDLNEWISGLQAAMEQEVVIDSLQVSGVEIDEGVTGKILFKGVRDVRRASDTLLSGRKHVLDTVQFKIFEYNKVFVIQLNNKGTAKLPVLLPDELLRQLRETFPRPT